MEGLVQGGHVYQALAPLYKITEKNNEKRYVWSKNELEEVLESEYKNKDVEVSRFKGLGEMNAQELKETTMQLGTRRLKQLLIEDGIQTDKLFSTLMGSSAQARKAWIEDNVDFDVVEE